MEYIGVDISVEALKLAKGANRILCDARLLPFRDCSFDVIFAFEVLEHLYDSEKIVSEIRRVVKSDGEFAVSVPNARSPFSRISYNGKDHVHWFTPRSLESMLDHFGFKYSRISNDIFLPILKVKLGKFAKLLPLDWHELIIRLCHLKHFNKKDVTA